MQVLQDLWQLQEHLGLGLDRKCSRTLHCLSVIFSGLSVEDGLVLFCFVLFCFVGKRARERLSCWGNRGP